MAFINPATAVHARQTTHFFSVVTCVLAGLFVAARFASRFFLRRRIGWDDWAILAAVLFSIVLSTLTCTEALKLGLGKHAIFLPFKTRTKTMELSWLGQIFCKLSVTLTKLSFLFLYLRLFPQPKTKRLFGRITYFAIALIATLGLASALVTLFQCTPVQRVYNRTIRGSCVHMRKLWYVGGGIFAGTDFAVWLLSVPIIVSTWQRLLSWRTKAAVGFVFGLGAFVCTASVLRVTSLPRQETILPDPTWDVVYPTIWSLLETNLAIICACLQPLALLFPGVFPVEAAALRGDGEGGERTGGEGKGSGRESPEDGA